MLETFISRTPFAYNIPSLDKLLQTKEIPSSFLAYDEQVLSILISAGISAGDAYACLKGIKKKKYDKVESYKDQFKTGFAKHLQENENATPEEAEKIVNNIWKIIESSASYLFNASHSLCVACDSLYVAWLKAHYPYETYLTMLKIWDERHNKNKTAAVISEMQRYKGIKLTAGKFGQDNRDWVVDKENHTISQSLSSVRYMSKKAAQDLQKLGGNSYSTFTDVLRDLQMNSCLDMRQIAILIELNYFEQFGKSGKLMKVYNEFFNGENKLTKIVKSFERRLQVCREFEASLDDDDLPISQRLSSELNNVGLCLFSDKTQPSNLYFVKDIDDKYGIKTTLYSIQRGTTGIVRVRKDNFAKQPFKSGDCFVLEKFNKSPKYSYRGGEKVALPNESDLWAEKYHIISAPVNN